ncbi:MAG: hypothetical protein ABGW50_06360, partial [Thermococcus sp.]
MRKDAGGVLLKFLSRQYGAPADITGAKITKKELHWVPVYFFYLHGRSRLWPTVEEVQFMGIPAGSPFKTLLEGYPFPIRGKVFFSEDVVKKGHYYEPEVPKEKAEELARVALINALIGEARQEDKSVSEDELELEIRYLGLVHYPLWELRYEYAGKEYWGYVDGTDGRIISAEYPLESGARKKASAMAMGVIGAGAVLGFIASAIFGTPFGLLGGLIPGAVGAWGIGSKGAVKKRIVSGVIKGRSGNLYFQPI